jgi:hypothetical protein
MIHVVARSQKTGDDFLRNHVTLAPEITIELGTRSYFELINRLIESTDKSYICIVHDDVYLCSDFSTKIADLVETLNRDRPNWGLAGNAGVLPFCVGYASTEIVRYISDPHGGPNLVGQILPAQSIDGNIMLLNLDAMRAKQLRVPPFEGFHLYDIILSIETLGANLGVYVCPQLACRHNSKGNQQEFDLAKSSDAFNAYLLERVRNRRITTLNGITDIRLTDARAAMRSGLDVQLASLRAATEDRYKKSVAIVTRTQFTRPALLKRTIDSVRAFISNAGDATHFLHYIVTDAKGPIPDSISKDVQVLRADFPEGDSRYQLVRFAAEEIDADFFWFLDDDDWLFPNEAERLGLVVNAAPANSIVFTDSAQFSERPFAADDDNDTVSCRSSLMRLFPAKQYLASLSGENHSPFCSVLLTRDTLRAIPARFYDTVTYYEDFMTILFALTSRNNLPIVVDKLFAGISVRQSGNTITERDRSKWDRSMSELVSHMVNQESTSSILSLAPSSYLIGTSAYRGELSHVRAQLNERSHLLHQIIHSRSWRLTRPLRGMGRLMRGEFGIRDLLRRLR